MDGGWEGLVATVRSRGRGGTSVLAQVAGSEVGRGLEADMVFGHRLQRLAAVARACGGGGAAGLPAD